MSCFYIYFCAYFFPVNNFLRNKLTRNHIGQIYEITLLNVSTERKENRLVQQGVKNEGKKWVQRMKQRDKLKRFNKERKGERNTQV